MTGIVGRFVLLLVLVSLGSGCSFVFVEPVPDYHRGLPPEEPVDCTSARAAPMIDTIIAAATLTATAVAAGADDDYEGDSVRANLTGPLLATAVATSSAVYGYITITNCREAKTKRAERLRRTWQRERYEQRAAEWAQRPHRRGADVEADGTRRQAPEPAAEEHHEPPAQEEREPAAQEKPEPEAQEEQEPAPELLERWGGPEEAAP